MSFLYLGVGSYELLFLQELAYFKLISSKSCFCDWMLLLDST